MALVGVRFVDTSGDTEVVDAEWRLSGKTPVVTVGAGSILAQNLSTVEIGGVSAASARFVSQEEGIPIPEIPTDGERAFTPSDGPAFLVALLALYGRSNGYSRVEPIRA